MSAHGTWGSLLASGQVDNICQEVDKSGLGYKYKDVRSVSMLGLVDDLIWIINAGYKAHQMNSMIISKTAEKRLQFRVPKCKSMLISKKPDIALNSQLVVDSCKTEHVENMNTGESELIEKY